MPPALTTAAPCRGRLVGPIEAVLCDRDGTLVVDVPYNGDPARVEVVPGVPAALGALRAAGLPVAIVTNQSGLALGRFTATDLAAVNGRVEQVLGPFPVVAVCPHGPADGCSCRKPAAGLVLEAAARLGVPPERCVVIGDTGADVAAASAAGAQAVLVPTSVTRPEEVVAAPVVAATFAEAVRLVLAV